MAITLEAGDAAPDFELGDQDGTVHRLGDYRGRTVVLYFYPRDETPGCTTEACSFRDAHEEITGEGAVVLGVSTDDAESHRRFRERHALPFPLLVDEEASVATSYGAWGEKVLYGRKTVGVIRSTVVIDEKGKVLKHWKRVPKAADHPQKVLEFLQQQG